MPSNPFASAPRISPSSSSSPRLYAQALEAAGIKVERKINLGGTLIAHKALEEKQIDLYPEYTGTMLLAVLKQPTR